MRARWCTGSQVEPEYVSQNFIPVALDTYFRGSSDELEFCQRIKAGGNHIVVATAGGKVLGSGEHIKMRERELGALVAEFRKLPDDERKPALGDFQGAAAPKRPVPQIPPGGLVIRGYCTYLRQGEDGRWVRSKEYYYKENPDRWAVETQSDMLWLTQAEWKSLLPAERGSVEVSPAIQKRFFSTIGIDFMEGSVNALPARETKMTITAEASDSLRLDGYAKLGKALDEASRVEKNTRGSELRVLGFLHVDRAKGEFDRFDVAGVGKAWGNKMDYVRREIRVAEYPWTYGIAWELVRSRRPIDLVPPYNMLHYGSGLKYFQSERP